MFFQFLSDSHVVRSILFFLSIGSCWAVTDIFDVAVFFRFVDWLVVPFV